MRVGVIGAGLQGRRRTSVFPTESGSHITAIACGHPNDDISSRRLAQSVGARAYANWQDVIHQDIDAVIICTPPHLHSEIAVEAMEAGKHVLCEKPLARKTEEAELMIHNARKYSVVLSCGFNHRHHPGILQAKRWVDSGLLGQPLFGRCTYGICGRPGFEKEWRANPNIVGGGQLMEQGIHAIDLFRWFLGEFDSVTAFLATTYWKIAPLEDNAFVILRNAQDRMAQLHSSLTQWKNLFSFEIFGNDGYIRVEGLGGAYGLEKVALGRREFDKPFSEQVIEYRSQDQSWQHEWHEFESSIVEKREPLSNGSDGLKAMRIVEAAYESNRTRSAVTIHH